MRKLNLTVLIAAGVSCLLAATLVTDALPFLRGGEIYRWQWPYIPVPLLRVLPLIFVTLVYIAGGLLLLGRWPRKGLIVTWALLGATVIPLAALAARSDDIPYELFIRTTSGITTGPHTAGAEIDWNAERTWRDWTAVMLDFDTRSGHIALSPPGAPMFYGLLNAVLDTTPAVSERLQQAFLPWQCHNYLMLVYTPAQWASASFGMLMPLWGALTVLPLYAVGRIMTDTPTAQRMILWWALVPALVMFVPTWNTLYPLFSLIAFWFLLSALHAPADQTRSRRLKLVMAGFITGLLTFVNVAMLPLAGLFGFYTLLHHWRHDQPWTTYWSRPILTGLWFAAGMIAPWALYILLTGVTPLEILQLAMGRHLGQERPYLPWVWFHFWEWVLFGGIGLVILWLSGIRRGTIPQRTLALALLLTLLVLGFSGIARGETGRVWLFLTPFVLLAAVPAALPLRGWAVLTSAQAVLMIALVATIPVIDVLDMTPPPAAPPVQTVTQAADAWFGEDLHLIGWQADAHEDSVTLHLNWQVRDQLTTPYWFAALLVDPDGTPTSESVVWQPLATRYPTTCWRPGAITSDTITLPLPEAAAAGDWWLSLVAFPDAAQPANRLTVQQANTPADTQLGLGPVPVD